MAGEERQRLYWATVCDIIGCAVKHDDEGVQSYGELLASNLEKDGQLSAANAVRHRLKNLPPGESLYLMEA